MAMVIGKMLNEGDGHGYGNDDVKGGDNSDVNGGDNGNANGDGNGNANGDGNLLENKLLQFGRGGDEPDITVLFHLRHKFWFQYF